MTVAREPEPLGGPRSGDVVISWTTGPDGGCTYLSEGWFEFTGQAVESALGFGWLAATHPADRDRAERAFLDAHARAEPVSLEYRLRRRDGEYRWARDAAAPRFGRDGAFLGHIGAVTDVTEQRATQEALKEREARYRALFSSIDEGYCLCELIFDADGTPVDYRFIEANPLFEEMTGLRFALGRTAYELVPNLERRWVETYAGVALGGTPLRFEDGSDAMGRWFDVFATPVEPRGRFALVFKDVSQRKAAEAAVQERELAEHRARRRAELAAELATELEAAGDFDARLQRFVALLVPRVADVAVVGAPGAVVALARGDGAAHPASDGLSPEYGASIARAAAGKEVLVPASHIAVPLDPGADARMALLLGLRDPGRRPYQREDLAFARHLADRAAVILARARANEEQRRIALRLQEALLPQAVLRHPDVEIAARYQGATDSLHVGGDWYDTVALPDGAIAVAVGDVMGHGLDAAAAMGQLRTALAALAPHADGPGELLANLDAFAARAVGVGFATACCAVLDPSTGTLRYASAGHPPMLVIGPDGVTRWLEEGRSPALYGEEHARPEAVTELEPGATLLLYSDGLVERRGESLDAGLGRLAAAAGEVGAAPVERVCERVIARLDGAAARDDVVVVCVRRLAPGSEASVAARVG